MPDGFSQHTLVAANTPNWLDGYVPPAAEWNAWWAQKLDIGDPIVTLGPYLRLVGGTLTGVLTLASDPANSLDASTKQYTDAGDAALTSAMSFKVNRAGDVMGGMLTLFDNPSQPFHAATKFYADAINTALTATKVNLAGDTMTGALVLSADPTAMLGAVTKQYADQRVLRSGDTLTGPLILSSDPITSISQATTKSYVDTTVANYVPLSQRAAALGVATLDASGVIPTNQLPSAVTGTLSYKGGWNPTTNTPTMASGALLNGVKQPIGDYYVVTASGTTAAIDGVTTWNAGDWISSNGTIWQRVMITPAPYLPLVGGSLTGTVSAPTLALTVGDQWRAMGVTPDLSWTLRDATGNIPLALDMTGTLLGLSASFSGTLSATGNVTFAGNLSATGTVATGALTASSLTVPTVTATAANVSTLTFPADTMPDVYGKVFDTAGNTVSYYGPDGTFNFIAGYTPTLRVDTLSAGGLAMAVAAIDQLNTKLINFALPSVPAIPDVVFPFFDDTGNIIAYFGSDATFHAVQLDAPTITQNGGPVTSGTSGGSRSDAIDVANVAYGAKGDACENLCYVTVTQGTPTLTAYNFTGNVSLAQTTATTATITIESAVRTGVAFQPYNVGQWLFLRVGAYTLQAQVVNYIDGSNVVVTASGVTVLTSQAGTVLCPSFTSDSVGKILLFDGMGQNVWWGNNWTQQFTDTRPPFGVTAFLSAISAVLGPDSISVAANFPYAWDGRPAHLIWGTNDSAAVALAGQDAVKQQKRKLYFSGDGKRYFLPGIVRFTAGESTYVPLQLHTSGALVATIWICDNGKVLSYTCGGYPSYKYAAPLGSDTGKWAPKLIFGRASLPRCAKLMTINVLITGDSLSTYNAQSQSTLYQQSRVFVEQFKRANPGKIINFYNVGIGGATYASMTDPVNRLTVTATDMTGPGPFFTVPKPFTAIPWINFYANANQTGVGPSIVPDLVVILDCGGNDGVGMDGGSVWTLLNAIRTVVHPDGFGPTDVLMQTDRIAIPTPYTSGNDGGVPFPVNLQWMSDYPTDLIRSTAITNGFGCIDLQPLADKASMGFDGQTENMRTAPSFNKLAVTPTNPMVLPYRQRDFAFWMTLPGAADNVVWPAIGGLDIQISLNRGNRLMLRQGINGNLWLGVATYGETLPTACTITAGSKTLTVGPPTTFPGQTMTIKNQWPQLGTSGAIFDVSMEGKSVVAPMGHRTGSIVQLMRTYIQSVLDPSNIITRDYTANSLAELDNIAGSILVGATQFIPQDGTATSDVTIFYPDGTIWNTQIAYGGYVSNIQVTLKDAAPQTLAGQTVPVHIGRMCVKWHDTGYALGTTNNPLAIEVSRHSLVIGYLYNATPYVTYINDYIVERWGKEFFPRIFPVQGSQEIDLSNIWISEPKPFMPTATPWEVRGIRDVNSDGYLGGVGGHSASPLRTEVIDPFYAFQDLSTY